MDLTQANLGVVVGPNASGKSSLNALIDPIVTAVTWCGSVDPVSTSFLRRSPSSDAHHAAAVHARHHHLPAGESVEARLGIELTSDEERELVASFMRAAIASSPPSSSSQRNSDQLESWAARLATNTFRALFRGELVVSHNGVAGSDWRVRFKPADKIGDVEVAVLMNPNEAILVRAGAKLPSNRRSDLSVMLGFDASPGSTQLTSSPPDPDDPDAVLKRLVPLDSDSGTTLLVRCPSPAPEQLPEATRVFLRRASLEGSLQPNSAWGPGVVWERMLRKGIRHLRAQGQLSPRFMTLD